MCVEDGLWSVMFFLHPVVANKKYLNDKLGWFFKLEKNFIKYRVYKVASSLVYRTPVTSGNYKTNVKKC